MLFITAIKLNMALRRIVSVASKYLLNTGVVTSNSVLMEKCIPPLSAELSHMEKQPFRISTEQACPNHSSLQKELAAHKTSKQNPESGSFLSLSKRKVRFYAARKGKRQALLAAKKARKLMKKDEPAPVKIRPFMRRTIDAVQKKARRCIDENWPKLLPVDDVWRTELYRGKPYSVSEAISMHQETHHPTILNEPDAFLMAAFELNMSLKKKNKYMEGFSGFLLFPHEFAGEILYNVIAICKNQEDQEKAEEAGAIWSGGVNIVKQLLSGEIKKEDYDFIVCHPDSYPDIVTLRGILKNNFPSTANGSLNLDVGKAVHQFRNGIKYCAVHDKHEPEFGSLSVCIGKLNMPFEQLEKNLKFLLTRIENHKPKGTENRIFITRVSLHCEKSNEIFKIPYWEYLPGYRLESSTGTVQVEDVVEVGEEGEDEEQKGSEERDAMELK